MPQDRFDIGVVIARRRLKGPWGGEEWLPFAVLPAVPEAASGVPLPSEDERQLCYGGASAVVLHSADTAHYRDNLASGRPSLWVAIEPLAEQGCRVATVTADPYEGEALAAAMDLVVGTVPMPPEIVERVGAFVAAFHVERAFIKRERDEIDPGTVAHAPVVSHGGGER